MQISSVTLAGFAFLFHLKKKKNNKKKQQQQGVKNELLLKESFSLNGNIHQYIDANFDHLDPHINFSDDDLANKRPIFSLCIF